MKPADINRALPHLFSELVYGAMSQGSFVLNSGDQGLMRALDDLSASDASRSVNGGATIAAHVQHLRIGLSLMNQWARERSDPYADPKWDEAWRVSEVNEAEWAEIRDGFRAEADQWREVLDSSLDVTDTELAGVIGSIIHVGYHLGAIRQIQRSTRGPRQGTFGAGA
jgi:hypothetical protein